MTKKFSTINSTLSPNELGKLIQQKYNLSDKTECSIFRLAMNHLYIVQDGEKKYVFRVYTYNWRTKLEIEEELRLLVHLKENDKQVAYPIADKSNEYIQEIEAPEGNRFGVGYSALKYATIPTQSTPPIPRQSTPVFRWKGYQLFRSKVRHFVKEA